MSDRGVFLVTRERPSSWNARPGRTRNESVIAGKWLHWLDGDNQWRPIVPRLVLEGGHYVARGMPYRLAVPVTAGGTLEQEVTNRADIYAKSLITAPPLVVSWTAMGVRSVTGSLQDLDGDGVDESVVYAGAYAPGIDLVYRVRWGVAPYVQKLVRFTIPLAVDATFQWRLAYSARVEISTRSLPDPRRPRLEQLWDGSGSLDAVDGFYVRLRDESQKRGAGIRQAHIWDTGLRVIEALPQKRQPVRVSLAASAGDFVLTKHVPAGFFLGVVLPVYTDTESTFEPDAGTGATTVDGQLTYQPGSTWAEARDAANATSVNPTAVTATNRIERELSGTSYTIQRTGLTFDTSTIPDTDTIDDPTTLELYLAQFGLDDRNNANSYLAVVSWAPAVDDNIAVGDYDAFGTTEWSTQLDLTGLTEQAYHNLTLNATGRSNVSKTGITKLGCRLGADILNQDPASDGKDTFRFATADETANHPILRVNHSASGPGPELYAAIYGQRPAPIEIWTRPTGIIGG